MIVRRKDRKDWRGTVRKKERKNERCYKQKVRERECRKQEGWCRSRGCAGAMDQCGRLFALVSFSSGVSPVPSPRPPHTISVCRTSKAASSPTSSPPSSSSQRWQLCGKDTQNKPQFKHCNNSSNWLRTTVKMCIVDKKIKLNELRNPLTFAIISAYAMYR